MASLVLAGCLGAPTDEPSVEGHDMGIEAGGWQGIPFTLDEASYVSYTVTPVGDAVLEICLVDITEGPMPTTGRPASAIGCHTSIGTEGGATIVPAGRYTLAVGCMNAAEPCSLDHEIELTALEEGWDHPNSI